MDFKNQIVVKPWGYEYLVYENEDVGLWFLHINHEHSTSLHCHPKKTTGLVLLDGDAELSFLSDSRLLKPLDKVMIRRGLFHSTKSLSPNGTNLFEIETPKDKHDLVRLNDVYGRESKPYENSVVMEKENLWINEPDLNDIHYHMFSNCNLKIETIDNIEIINNKNDSDLIMFLKGGLIRNINQISHCVTIPGDVGYGRIIKKVSSQLDNVVPGTIIMTITK